MARKDSFKMDRAEPVKMERKESFKIERNESFKKSPQAIAQIEEQREIIKKSETRDSLKKQDPYDRQVVTRKKSVSTSEDESKKRPSSGVGPPVVLRRKPSAGEEYAKAHQSRSTSEDDNEVAVANHRHSRYLESFDVRKKYHENVQGPPVPRKPRRQSGGQDVNPPETIQQTSQEQTKEQYQRKPQPQLPQPPPPSTDPTPLPSPSVRETETTPTPTQQKKEPRSQSQSPVDKARQTPPKPPRTSTPTRRSQAGSPTKTSSSSVPTSSTAAGPAMKKPYSHIDRQSVHSTDEPVESSESERDSDLAAAELKRRHLSLNVGCIEDHESTGLVSQESFDDELPYIPTNLPEEKAQVVNLIPMKERANMELKTCPVERPRSTTPLNPSHLEEYCGIVNTPDATHDFPGVVPVRGEKLRISLPRKDSKKDMQSSKSPRRISNASGKSWFEFAEEGLRATTAHLERKDSNKQLLQQKPPPTTTREIPKPKQEVTKPKTPTTKPRTPTQRKLSGHWIDFENIPEKRKPPKKITTLPRDSSSAKASSTSTTQQSAATRSSTHGKTLPGSGGSGSSDFKAHQAFEAHKPQPDVTATTPASNNQSTTDGAGTPHYDYVKPEDCQCECHETKTKEATASASGTETSTTTAAPITTCTGTGTATTTADNTKAQQGVDLLQQGEDMLPLLSHDSHDGIEPR